MPHKANMTKPIEIPIFEWTTDVETGDGKFYFKVTSNLDGFKLTKAEGTVITAGTTGSTDVQIHNVNEAVDMLSSKIAIPSAGTSHTGTINVPNSGVSEGDLLRVDFDSVSSTAPKGFILILEFEE